VEYKFEYQVEIKQKCMYRRRSQFLKFNNWYEDLISGSISQIILLKGIVSQDFGVLFLIYLDRYEVPKRAGSGLFFIL
jgi:hypothetical protein